MRGEILRYDDNGGSGLISGDDGVRYAFTRADLQQLAPLAAGQRVDFAPVEGQATQIFLVGDPVVAPPPPSPPPPQRGVWGHFVYCLKNYVNGHGRASRSEYWSFALFEIIFLIVAVIIDSIITAMVGHPPDQQSFLPIFTCLIVLGLCLPAICVLIRRMHDVGLSGWLVLVSGVPYVGGLFTFVVSLLPGQIGPNKHGPGPGWS